MNTYKPFQRQSDKRWDYACENNGHIHPVGYCAPYREWWTNSPSSQEAIDAYKATADKHHSNGHATPDEAAECYRNYLLDHRLELKIENKHAQHKCDICGDWTNLYASVNKLSKWGLCEIHNTREQVDALFELTGDMVTWSSW